MRWTTLLCLCFSLWASASPTETREWTSSVGSKIEAKATALIAGKVTLKTSTGRTIKLPLTQLSAEDQAFLKEHFKPGAMTAPEAKAPELSHPLGESVGPIDAGDGSSYFLYLPTTMIEGVDAPLVFWTGWNQSTKNRMDAFIEVAELTGMALAASVEAKNGPDAFVINNKHTKTCLKHIGKNFPIDVERVFFSGSSGGGASAFYNSGSLKCAGAMPMVAYIPQGTKPHKKGFYYIIGGANDFNRYSSASAKKTLGARAAYRMHVGGHHKPITPAIAFEGSLWLYTRHVYEKPKTYATELAHFEPRLLKWLEDQKNKAPHTAYFWTQHLGKTCQVEGDLAEAVATLDEELIKNEQATRFLEAHRALEQFGLDVLIKEGKSSGSLLKHTTPAIQKGVEKLKEKYAGLPEIDAILAELAKPTDST